MRIIAGNYRGKKLFSPESDKVRPTADRAREALFNILHSSLEKDWSAYKLLDVFAGTGAFALTLLTLCPDAMRRSSRRRSILSGAINSAQKSITFLLYTNSAVFSTIVKPVHKKIAFRLA